MLGEEVGELDCAGIADELVVEDDARGGFEGFQLRRN